MAKPDITNMLTSPSGKRYRDGGKEPLDPIGLGRNITSLYLGSTQGTVTGDGFVIDWDQEVRDDGNWHSTTTNPSRVTVTEDGIYLVSFGGLFAANATGARSAFLLVNGGVARTDSRMGTPTDATGVAVHDLQILSAGDYIEIRVLQQSGGGLNLFGGFPGFTNLRVAQL